MYMGGPVRFFRGSHKVNNVTLGTTIEMGLVIVPT
jgi:hypothetical protein